MNRLTALLLLLISVYTLPSVFDIRVQPQYLKYSDFQLRPEGICASYAWAKELAQIVSNAVSRYEQTRLVLSAQQILECTQLQTDPCYKVTLQAIHQGLQFIQKQGITTTDCYPNRPFSYPSSFCKRQCHDGSPFDFNYFVSVSPLASFSDVVQVFKSNDKAALMAVLKIDDKFNYYSSFSPFLTQGGPKEVMEYRLAQILGWKDGNSNNPKLILRAGFGQEWGYNGFIELDLQRYQGYVQEYYKVQLADTVAQA